MNWYTITHNIIYIFFSWASISAGYYLTKQQVLTTRLKSNNKATITGVILLVVVSTFLSLLSACICSMHKGDAYVISLFAITSISCYVGAYYGYKEDSKLTIEQKEEKRTQNENERLRRIYNNEW